MEAGGVGDGLDEIGVGCVGIRSRNGGVLATCKRWDRRSEGIPEIGVLGSAAVTRPPCRVDGELGQVRQPAEGFVRPGRLTALQRAEFVQIHHLSAFEGEIREPLAKRLTISV